MFYLKLPQPRQVWATDIPPKCLPIWHRVSVNPGGGQRLEACHHHQTGLATDLFYFFNLVNPGGAECAVTYHQTRPFGNETVFQYFFARDPDKHFKSWLWCFVKKRSSCPLTKTTFALVFRSSWASRSCWTSQTSKTQHKQRLTQSTGGCSRSGLPSWFLVVDPPHARAPPPPPPLSFCFDVPHTSNISSLFQIYHEQVSRVWCERLFTNVDVYQSNRNRRRLHSHPVAIQLNIRG